MSQEIWKDVVGYEGIYQVSDLGRVKSLDRTQVNGILRRGRVLRGSSRGDYWRVSLRDLNGSLKVRNVHLLVLDAFVGPRPDGLVCRHLNGNARDNRLENLCWGTREENELDKPTDRVLSGERHWGNRFTEDQIRQMKYGNLSQRKTAKLFGTRQAYISRLRSGDRWAHV
jgi:hypothetical protein